MRLSSKRTRVVLVVPVVAMSMLAAWVHVAQAQVSTATPQPPPSPASISSPLATTVASIPLFARFAADGANPSSYSVPIHLVASLHKLIFSFAFRRDGMVSFSQPDVLRVSIKSVPQQYAHVFGELGTPRTWPMLYDLRIVGSQLIGGRAWYQLRGVPRNPSDVDHVIIQVADEKSPIRARWFLHGGWTLTSTVNLVPVQDYLVPRREQADITGHGYRIHSDITYGNYMLNVADDP